jgi:hypothetical protein
MTRSFLVPLALAAWLLMWGLYMLAFRLAFPHAWEAGVTMFAPSCPFAGNVVEFTTVLLGGVSICIGGKQD